MVTKNANSTPIVAPVLSPAHMSMFEGLVPEYGDPIKHTRGSKYNESDISGAVSILEKTYTSGQAARFTLPKDVADKMVNLFRFAASTVDAGLSIKYDNGVLSVQGKARTTRKMVEGKPRKPRATKALAGTVEYAERLAQYEIALAEWNAAQGS